MTKKEVSARINTRVRLKETKLEGTIKDYCLLGGELMGKNRGGMFEVAFDMYDGEVSLIFGDRLVAIGTPKE